MIRGIFSAYYWLLNYLVFFPRSVSYSSFPRIKGVIAIQGSGQISFGNEVEINSGLKANPVGMGVKTIFSVGANARIEIGDSVGISNALFYAVSEIVIEDEVLIGGGTQIIDSDFHSLIYKERMERKYVGVQSAKVLVKKGAFIGMNCLVLKGVTIGERSVVAANSVVVKSIPSDELWGGNPARFIRKIV